jgi:hypothetical protein
LEVLYYWLGQLVLLVGRMLVAVLFRRVVAHIARA